MTKAKRMLSLLLAVIMILSVIPITASAAEHDSDPSDGPSTGVNGLYMNKTVNSAHNELTLEAFVTGRSQTQITKVPVDIALVLDVSGSMDYYITVGSGTTVLSMLDTKYGGAEGMYEMRIADALGVTRWYDMRYRNGVWQYKSILSGWVNLIGSGYEDNVKNTRITILNALKIATKHFIDSASASSESTDPNQIAIVSYANKATTVKELTAVNIDRVAIP